MNFSFFGHRRWLLAFSAFAAAAICLTGIDKVKAQGGAQIVKSIDVEYVGSAAIAKDRILAAMSTKVGETLSPVKIDEDIKNLYASGDYENIRVLSKPVSGGVALKLVIQTRSMLGEVRFVGNSAIDSDKLRRQTDLRVNRAIDETEVREGRDKILAQYRKRGFPEATVSYEVSAPDRAGFSTVTFTINEGGQAKLRDVTFVGNEVFTSSELKDQMEQKPKSLLNPFAREARIDDSTLETDIRSIEDFYQNNGYLGAHVVNVSRVRVEGGEEVDLVITINEGTPYTIGNVTVTGVEALSLENDILPYIKTQSGNAYSGQFLKDDIALIRDQYGTFGYADARVTPKLDPAGANAVSVTFEVTEGRSYAVGQISIEGNTKTKDHVIRRELAIKPGDPFNQNRIDVSRAKLRNMGYFADVDIVPVDTGSMIDEKDLIITVVEDKTAKLDLGGGFGSDENFFLFIQFTQTNFDLFDWPNFIGGGQRLLFSIRAGDEYQNARFSLTEPWFMGKNINLTVNAFYLDENNISPGDYWEQTTIGGGFSLWKPIGSKEFLRASVGVQPQNVDVDVDRRASPELLAEDGDYAYIPIEASLTYDTRDSFYLPRNGGRYRAGVEAGVGGDTNAVTLTATGSHHFNVLNDHILNLYGSFANVSDADQIFVRQFLGGAKRLRGFDYRDVGPKDSNGEPLGGDQLWYLATEYTVPIYQEVFRGAIFYEIGEVSGGPGRFGGGVNSDWGIGVRAYLPQFGGAPFTLDYAWPIDSDEFNDSGGEIKIGMGATF